MQTSVVTWSSDHWRWTSWPNLMKKKVIMFLKWHGRLLSLIWMVTPITDLITGLLFGTMSIVGSTNHQFNYRIDREDWIPPVLPNSCYNTLLLHFKVGKYWIELYWKGRQSCECLRSCEWWSLRFYCHTTTI